MISARVHAGLTYYLRRIGRCAAPLSPLIETIVCRSAVDPWSEVQRGPLLLPLSRSPPFIAPLACSLTCVLLLRHAGARDRLRAPARSMILMKRSSLLSWSRKGSEPRAPLRGRFARVARRMVDGEFAMISHLVSARWHYRALISHAQRDNQDVMNIIRIISN